MNNTTSQTEDALTLLQSLIRTASFSKEENQTANILQSFIQYYCDDVQSIKNNIWVRNKYYSARKPTILLNSHHDTVPPNQGYTIDPYDAKIEDGKLFGLGSNDAGGALVSLLMTFLHFYSEENLKYNLIFAATAEEEISGINGIELLYPQLGKIDAAIIGEPTQMQMAIAEKGLMVIDCSVNGRAGHAARDEGENAIYKALEDISWFQHFKYEKVSPLLGPAKMSVTILQAGSQHNMVPSECNFTVDIRINELYSHEEILEIISKHTTCSVSPRSTRIRSSTISQMHPLVQSGLSLSLKTYGSPTTSDKALLPCPALKIGPGDSARSHMADEFIYVNELEEGINIYIQLLNNIL